jgi:hypothetical protein
VTTTARSSGATVTINGYHRIDSGFSATTTRTAKRPTGYYAPPGEIVSLTFPPEVVNKGVNVLVGHNNRDYTGWMFSQNRFPRISKTFAVESNTVEVANPFGGGIYILIKNDSLAGEFDVMIDGAAPSAYFSYTATNTTDPDTWRGMMDTIGVPWVDIECEGMMWTMPSDAVPDTATDPTPHLQAWDVIFDSIAMVFGRSTTQERSQYLAWDRRLPFANFSGGYPMLK